MNGMGSSLHLHGNEPIVDHHFFGQEIGADGRLVLVGELLVDILVHQRRLADARIAQDDHFQKHLFPGRHGRQ